MQACHPSRSRGDWEDSRAIRMKGVRLVALMGRLCFPRKLCQGWLQLHHRYSLSINGPSTCYACTWVTHIKWARFPDECILYSPFQCLPRLATTYICTCTYDQVRTYICTYGSERALHYCANIQPLHKSSEVTATTLHYLSWRRECEMHMYMYICRGLQLKPQTKHPPHTQLYCMYNCQKGYTHSSLSFWD